VGEHLYVTKCSHCHGIKGEQSVFETSAVIQGWESNKTLEALHGYKENSYGSTKKGVMKVVVARLNEDSMKDVAVYIETLK
jgi:cytochrome c553